MTPARPAFRVKPTVTVGVEVRRADGSVRSSYVSPPEDIATDNFVKFLAALLERAQNTNHTFTMVDTGAASRTFNLYTTATSGSTFMFYGASAAMQLAIGDGGGSTPTPDSGDTNLVSQFGITQASDPTKAGTKVTIGASILNNTGASKTVREVGVIAKHNDTGSTARSVLMFYEDTPDIPVADGESVAVTYTFDWPDDTTNDNWIEFWRTYFAAGTGSVIQGTFLDTGAASRTLTVYSTSPSSVIWQQDSGNCETRIEFGDGGGSAVTPAEDDTALVQVLAAVQISTPSRAGGVVSCAATYSNDSGVSKTLREGGLTMGFLRTSNTYDRILMFHFATPDTVVADGASKIGELTITLPYA